MGKRTYKIEVGEKFHWYDRDLWHIINIFQHDNETFVVLKSWAKYKNRWVFKVDTKESIEWWFSTHVFNEVNTSKKS